MGNPEPSMIPEIQWLSNDTHAIIQTVLHYNTSKFYGNNTAVILFLAEVEKTLEHNWNCYSSNKQEEFKISTATPKRQYNDHAGCQLTSFFITCNTVPTPDNFYIFDSVTKQGSTVKLQFDYPVNENLGVVSCMNSVHFRERWQLYLMSIEYHHYLGIERQVYYLMSSFKEVYKLLLGYQKEHMIDLRYWSIPNIPEIRSFENTWNRDQIGILNDCFMRYREAAEFIIVHDPDEFIMFPGGPKLYNAINSLYTKDVAFIYFYAYKTNVYSTKKISTFDYVKTMKNTKITKVETAGKCVYRPDIVESVGVHSGYNYIKGKEVLWLNSTVGIVAHFRNWEFLDDGVEPPNPYDKADIYNNISYYVSDFQLNRIASNFRLRTNRFFANEMIKNLSDYGYYYKLTDKCMEYTTTKCQSLQNCKIPEIPNLTCVQVRQQFHKKSTSEVFHFHIPGEYKLVYKHNGCSVI